MTFDKELLFKSALPEAEVEIPGKGTIRVRAMTRAEVLKIRSAVKDEADAIKRQAEIERKMLAVAVVEPDLTEDDVRRWQEASAAGEIDLVSDKVTELSGMGEGADKEAYVEFEENPDAEFRLPPG